MDHAEAHERAIRILTLRAHSRFELVRKLRQRGASPEVAQSAADRAQAAGYVNDQDYALSYARSGRERGLAPSRIRRELLKRGIEPGAAESALAEEFAEADLEAMAVALARKRVPRLSGDRDSVRRRLAAYLERRGFPAHACLAAVDAVAPLN